MSANTFDLLLILILLPLAGFIISLLVPSSKEKYLSRWAGFVVNAQFLLHLILMAGWAMNGFRTLSIEELVLYRTDNYLFAITLQYDFLSAIFLFIGTFVTVIIAHYSRYYMHLESGFKRFFNTILFFFLAYCTTVLAGNFETLFAGWEMLGISSFLLIAFYRERISASRNAMKVYSVYRLGDVGILMAIWASHHLWHENITFVKLADRELVHEVLAGHSALGVFIALCLLVAAGAKSAQLPFSSWLPRAMEGPTPSSAIFYGSLSVHFGVFLLLRTFPFWEEQTIARWAIGLSGLVTTVWAYPMARIQSTIKTQIAYASIAQIGIMFIEIALGLRYLVMLHFAGNAFLRTYQILVSPSVVAYLIRQNLYAVARPNGKFQSLLAGLSPRFYIYSVLEWRTDILLNFLVFYPMRSMGKLLDFLKPNNMLVFSLLFFVPAAMPLFWNIGLSETAMDILSLVYGFIGWWMVAKAFSEKIYPRLSFGLIIMSHMWISLAVSFSVHYSATENILYLSGVLVFGLTGIAILQIIRNKYFPHFDLRHYYGYSGEMPVISALFLLCALGVTAFPISPTFIGLDVIFGHIHENQYALAFFYASSYVLSGISVMRIYTHLFLGSKS